jgi:ribonuclease HI
MVVYTDGACIGNPGPGGWAAVILSDGRRQEIGAAVTHTTNNPKALTPAVETQRAVPDDAAVQIVTDSEYLHNGMTKWLVSWRERQWRTRSGQTVENRDLWEELAKLAGERVHWEWVRGHSGHVENERADRLARAYARGEQPPEQPIAVSAGNKSPASSAGDSADTIEYLSLVSGVVERHGSWDECRRRVHGVSGAQYKKCRNAVEAAAVLAEWGTSEDMLTPADPPPAPTPPAGGPERVRIATYLSLVGGVLQRHGTWAECEAVTRGVRNPRYKKCSSPEEEAAFVEACGLPLAALEALGAIAPGQQVVTAPPAALLSLEFVAEAAGRLGEAGFRPVTTKHTDARFRLERERAIVSIYETGLAQCQGRWTQTDADIWAKLLEADAARPEVGAEATHPCIAWDVQDPRYLLALCRTARLPGWDVEPIGRQLVLTRDTNAEPVGLLSLSGWRHRPADAVLSELAHAITVARQRPDRWCLGIRRESDELSLYAIPLTPAVQWLAMARRWDVAREHVLEWREQYRLAGQIRRALHEASGVHGHWASVEVSRQTEQLGTELDHVYDWLRDQLPSFSPKRAGVDLGAGGEAWRGGPHPGD